MEDTLQWDYFKFWRNQLGQHFQVLWKHFNSHVFNSGIRVRAFEPGLSLLRETNLLSAQCTIFPTQKVSNLTKTRSVTTKQNLKELTMNCFRWQQPDVAGLKSHTSCSHSTVMLRKRRCGSQRRSILFSPLIMAMTWTVAWSFSTNMRCKAFCCF